MALDAMRSLYVVVGVDTAPAIASLGGLNAEFLKTEKSAMGLLATVLSLQKALGAGAASFAAPGTAMADSFIGASAQLAKLRADARAPIKVTYEATGSMAAPGGGGGGAGAAGGGAGRYTVASSMLRSAAYLGVYAGAHQINEAATADFALRRASLISGRNMEESLGIQGRLQRDYYLTAADAANAQLAASQLGLRNSALEERVASAASGLHDVYPEISTADATTAIYRLASTTAHGTAEERATYIANMMANSRGVASAILRVGEQTAGGPTGTISMLSRLEAAGSLTGLSAGQLIAISGALQSVDPNRAATAAGAIERFFGKDLTPTSESALQKLGVDTKLARTNPDAYIASLAQAMSKVPTGQMADLLKGMGISNVRDLTLAADLGQSFSKLKENIDSVNKEMVAGTFFDQQMNAYRDSVRGSFDQLRSSLSALALSLTEVFGPAIAAFASGLAVTLHNVAANRELTFVAGSAMLAGGLAYFGKKYGFFGKVAEEAIVGGKVVGAGSKLSLMQRVMPWLHGEAYIDKTAMAMANLSFMGEAPMGMEKAAEWSRLAGKYATRDRAAGSFINRMTGGLWEKTLGRKVISEETLGWAEKKMLAGGGAGFMERMGVKLAIGTSTFGIGDIALALGALAPLFHGLATWLDKLGSGGGLVGVLTKTLSLFAKSLALVGDVVNRIMDGVMWVLSRIEKIPGVKEILEGANKGLSWLGHGLDSASNAVKGDKGAPKPSIPSVTHNWEVKVGSQSSMQQTIARGADRSANGTSSVAAAGGS